MHVAMLVLDDPWSSSHGGTQRTLAFIEAFVALGHRVSCVYVTSRDTTPEHRNGAWVVPVHAPPMGERSIPEPLKRLKKLLLPLPTVAGARSGRIRDALSALEDVDVFLVQQLRTAQYQGSISADVIWFDQVDLLSAFVESEVAILPRMARPTARLQGRGFRRMEQNYARTATVVTTAGYGDAVALNTFSGCNAQWLPNPTNLQSYSHGSAPPKRIAGLLGNFNYWPNRAAFDVLSAHWAPRIAAQGWTTIVAGHGSEALPRDPLIRNLGSLDNAEDFYAQVSVSLAPILTGGGIKVKILESLAAGIPVVATPASLEGFSPSYRRFTLETSPTGEELEDLEAYLDSWQPMPPELKEAFSQDRFTAHVEQLLKR